MKRILLASVAVLGLAGVAAAQQAPVAVGNYDAAVQQSLDNNQAPVAGVDLQTTQSIRSDYGFAAVSETHQDPVNTYNYGR